ncbi:hypothetical protein [Candidatus Ferrigenium straubiae]|uniref:hypothetical protein n=1 Tax=Candidatus Ferrigenium straubiae TaxID=2919506 RepID=UPI003F4A92B3
MQSRWKKPVLAIMLSVTIAGCVTPPVKFQAYEVKPSNKIPLEIGAAAEALLGKCVNSVDKSGFAQYSACVGDFKSYYGTIIETGADLHDKGIFQIDAKLGYKELSLGGGVHYYSEYKVDKQLSKEPKGKYDLEELNLLYESCVASPPTQYIIETVYRGCSATDNIEKVEQVDSKYLKNFINAGGFRNGVKVIGDPVNFNTGEETKNNVSCGSPQIIAVGVVPVSNICKNIDVHRMSEFQKNIHSLEKQILGLKGENDLLKEKMETYKGSVENLKSKTKKQEATISELNKKIAEGNTDSQVLLNQLNTAKTGLGSVETKLEKAVANANQLALEVISQKNVYEKKLLDLNAEKKNLDEDLGRLNKTLTDTFKKLEDAKADIVRSEKLRNEAEEEAKQLRKLAQAKKQNEKDIEQSASVAYKN